MGTKSWWQLKEEFGKDPEKLESEFTLAVWPYKFVKRDWWSDYNYVHWLIYAPEQDLDEPSTPGRPHMPVVVIGGHSREGEAREIAIRLKEARGAGWMEGFTSGMNHAERKKEGKSETS